jgi:hypothetical protein
VFKVWFLTLAVVILVFAEKLSGLRHLAPPFSSVFQSFQMMIGLVVPQIGVMSAFYFNLDNQKDKIASLSNEQVTVVTMLSLTYHVIFVAAVVFGIGLYRFDQQADGNSLERNTAAVVALMGLFSVFLTPIAFLFSTPKAEESTEAQEGSEL